MKKERERERARRASETPEQREEWCQVRRERVSLGKHTVEYNVRGQLHRKEQNQATQEGCQADPVSRSKSAQILRRDNTREQKRMIVLIV